MSGVVRVYVVVLAIVLMSGVASAAWDDATFTDSNPKDAIGYRFNLSNMSLADQWDGETIIYPILEGRSGEYTIWYRGSDGRYRAATSSDGLNWAAYSEQVNSADIRDDGSHSINNTTDLIVPADTEEPSQIQEFYDGMISYIWGALMYDYKL